MSRRLWLVVMLMVWTLSCSHWSSTHQRSLASLDDESCAGWLKPLLKTDKEDVLEQDLRRYLDRRVRAYWNWHDNVSWWRYPAERLTRVRRLWLKWFQSLNANPVPVFYVEDASATSASILKYESHFKKSQGVDTVADATKEAKAVSEARDSINKWIDRLRSYPERLMNQSRELYVLEFAIRDLNKEIEEVRSSNKRQFHKVISYDSMDFIDESKPELGKYYKTEKFVAKDIADINAVIRDLKRRKKAIASPIVGKGSRREIELKQAKDRKRLEMLYDRLLNLKLTNEANGFENDLEHLAMLNRLHHYLYERPDLMPTENIVMRLEAREAWAETQGLYKKMTESEFTQKLKAIYDTLTPEEKQYLGLDSRGLSGAVINFATRNRYWIFGTTLFAGSGVAISQQDRITEGLRQWGDFFTSDYTKRRRCIDKGTKKNAFENCVQEYLAEKYALKRPLAFVYSGYEGLLEALKGDKDKASEFREIVEYFKRERTKKLVKDAEEEEIWDEITEEINQAVKEALKARQDEKSRQGEVDQTATQPAENDGEDNPPPVQPIPNFNP